MYCYLLLIINIICYAFIWYKELFYFFEKILITLSGREWVWCQRLHLPRERPVEGGGVVVEVQTRQFGQQAQLRGDRSGNGVAVDIKPSVPSVGPAQRD